MIKKGLLFVFISVSLFLSANNPLWMRYPAISPDGNSIAFSYMADIYKVSSEGGTAVRLTTNPAFDSNPIWSPDGKSIAFVSDRHNGSQDIYLMSTDGGAAKRLTYHSAVETPSDFTPDGKYVVFSASYQDPVTSALFPTSRFSEVYQVPVVGGVAEQIIAFPAVHVKFASSGKKVIFLDLKGFENTWRKHHTSSVTRDIVEYDFTTNSIRKLIDRPGEDLNPVFAPDGKSFYFLSEKSGSLNVFAATLDNPSEYKQITHFKEHPVRFLSVSRQGALCYGFDGEIYLQSNLNSKPKKVKISIQNDLNEEDQVKELSLTSGATAFSVSPDGKQVAFIVRGDLFVTSADYNTTKQVTSTVAPEGTVDFGKDNRSLVYSSYRNGKWNVFQAKISRDEEPNFPHATLIEETELIQGDKSEKQYPQYSPDGKEIAFMKERNKLMVYNLESGKTRQITDGRFQHDRRGSIRYNWSPDGKWFALEYIANGHAPYSDIGIVSSNGGEVFNLTNSGYINSNPRWVLDGNALIYRSEQYGMRSHASWGALEDVMIVFLNREAFNNFKMSKEEHELFTEGDNEKNKKKEDTPTENEIHIEFENIDERVMRLTPNSSKLGDAIINKEATKLYYLTSFEDDYDMWVYDLRKKSTTLLKKLKGGFSQLQTDQNEKTLFVMSGKSMQKMTFSNDKFTPVTFKADMKTDLRDERLSMFDEVYSELKQRFYREDMHGVNWDKLTKHYRKFLPHINNNYDFSEMLSELLGELNVSHTGSRYNPVPTGDLTAELGLIFNREKGINGLIISEVLVNGPFDHFRSKTKPGDIIEKIDGIELNQKTDHVVLLAGKAGKNTLISLYSPGSGERWEEVIKPITAAAVNSLLYKRWVKQRAAEVERLSNGRLGYVHIASMGDDSFRKMYSDALGKYYKKEGMVIDIRYNGGGRLHEDIEMFFNSKKYLDQEIRGKDYCEMPSKRWNNPSVMVMTEADYSNAHGTPWVYNHLGIGKLVGMPVPGTMTSVNWVRQQDPTMVFGIPVIGYRTADGGYLENSQLEPDVKAPLDLIRAVQGHDSQLEVAVQVLLNEIDGK